MPPNPETAVTLAPPVEGQEAERGEVSRFRDIVDRTKHLAGRSALALALAAGSAVAGTAGEAVLFPSTAAAESVADYPWADAPDVPNPPANDDITWGYQNKATCDGKSASYDCSSTSFPGPWYYRDQWGYDLRNCTSYVAWRVAANLGKDASGLGFATNWNNNAPTGWAVDTTPEPGDIAHWEGNDANPGLSPGHVAFVESVNANRSVNISEFNRGLDGNSGTRSNVTADDYIDTNGAGKGLYNLPIGGGGGSANDKINELGFVRTNHGSGQAELVTWHGAPSYTTLRVPSQTGYLAISDPENVTPLAIDVNGDGIDELGFVRTNHASGRTELSLWHGSPHYTTHVTTVQTGYPAISDPENVTPLAIDVNGDGIDELGFVRFNHSSGKTQLSLWHGSPNYTTYLPSALTGYPAITDPENVTPIAIDVNGDGIDELGFVRSNHGSGKTQISVWHGAPNYTTHLATTAGGYPAISDPANVTPLAIDVNGDKIDELGFARTNHSSGRTELSLWHGAPYYTTHLTTPLTGYPTVSDPQNVTVLPIHLPNA